MKTKTITKKTILILIVLLTVFACKRERKKEVIKEKTLTIAPFSDNILETATIYEANIRQYSPEGTFNEFTKDIPKLKDLGIDIIWLMPIYPISTTKSKGSLGSYYAVSDYTKVNPEFGTLDDFRNLVKIAHRNNIYIILDWVANHTGWDHVWLKEHPDYYTKNDQGEITHTVGTDWSDVADLNYNNKAMRKAMIKSMKYWLKEEDVDGFRCDVASMVPTDFWESAVMQLKKIKPIFMLAESDAPELFVNIFDMGYGWEAHHIMNEIAKGNETVKALDDYMMKIDTVFQQDAILMNFTSNHDENSWKGTVYELYGDGAETFAALTYMLPGTPLIYSGQEYDMNKRLAFFEKDTIPKTMGKFYPFYKKMNILKMASDAMHGGKEAAAYRRIITSDDKKIIAFKRIKGNDELLFIANLTPKAVTFSLNTSGDYRNYADKGGIETFKKETKMTFQPWQYEILIRLR